VSDRVPGAQLGYIIEQLRKPVARPSGLRRVRNHCFYIVLILLCAASRAGAQCSPAPAAFSEACTEMQSYINAFNTTISSQWNGTKAPVAFGTELLAADDNIGLSGLLAPNALTKVQTELDAFDRLGVQFVTIAVSFPILYQPFYESGTKTGDVNVGWMAIWREYGGGSRKLGFDDV
jgi:hypothetical protein